MFKHLFSFSHTYHFKTLRQLCCECLLSVYLKFSCSQYETLAISVNQINWTSSKVYQPSVSMLSQEGGIVTQSRVSY